MIDDWIFAECPEKMVGLSTDCEDHDNAGKWMIFSPPDAVDEDWRKIKTAVEAGHLSISAKVATRCNGIERVSPLAIINGEWDGPRHHVICVYTANWRDREDVFQHRETLRELGFDQTLFYKTNEMTRQGKRGSTYRG